MSSSAKTHQPPAESKPTKPTNPVELPVLRKKLLEMIMRSENGRQVKPK